MFPCEMIPLSQPLCVSELQFCDGIIDCPSGSDEPSDCGTGNENCGHILMHEVKHFQLCRMFNTWRNTVGEWKQHWWE